MKTLKWKIDLTFLKDGEKHDLKDLFNNYLTSALATRFGRIDGKYRRMQSRIMRKVDDATIDFIELEEAEFDLVKDAFDPDRSKFEPNQTRIVCQIEDAIEKAAEDSKKQNDEKKS